MNVKLNNNQTYLIIKRFNSKFKVRKKDKPNPKLVLFTLNDIFLLKAYKFICNYTNDNHNEKKENLVIKYLFKNETVPISLNLLLDEYNDIIK